MYTVGIDPGLHGAIGILRDGEYVNLLDMPTILKATGSTKYEVNPSAVLQFLRAKLPAGEACKALLERVSAMPGQGVTSMFSLGDSFGCVRAVLACGGIPFQMVPPAKWKKYFGLTSDKEASRALAVKLFPIAELHLKKHDGRAEALLIARYLWETEFK